MSPLIGWARQLWERLAMARVAFPAGGGVDVVASPRSLLCPPQWCGIVVLGDSGIATAPTQEQAVVVRAALAGLPGPLLTDPARLRRLLPVGDLLGPASLGYLRQSRFRPADGAADQLPADHADVASLLATVPADDRAESGLATITSPAYVLRRGGAVVAAAGYRRWLGSVAHLCLLVAPEHRGRGLARAVASAAVADAVSHPLLPQWRARSASSRRVAASLGFEELGAQVFLRLDHNGLSSATARVANPKTP